MEDLSGYMPDSWREFLKDEVQSEAFRALGEKLLKRYAECEIYPAKENLFNAFKLCPLEKISVVVLGQDPYHNAGQANGLAFSVPKGMKLPPSLKNIYKELQADLGYQIPFHGDLSHWARQGVLLINAIFSVEANKPASHSQLGWQNFTDSLIGKLSAEKKNLVFVLWGNFAQSKIPLIDENAHLIIKSAHPSPLSARNGFFGSKPFSRVNEYLLKQQKTPINWELPVYLN